MHNFSAYKYSSAYEIIPNFNLLKYKNVIDLSLLRSESVHDFKTVSLTFLVTFNAIF